MPRVSNSAKSPCWQQIEIARQNSWFASRRAGREIVYDPPCLMDGKPEPKPEPKSEPKPAGPALAGAAPRTS